MSGYCVISLEDYAKPVHEEKIEKVINEMADHGWSLYQISIDGGRESGFYVLGLPFFEQLGLDE